MIAKYNGWSSFVVVLVWVAEAIFGGFTLALHIDLQCDHILIACLYVA